VLDALNLNGRTTMGEIIDTLKGKAKQAQGRMTGDREKEAEGVADEMKGKAKGAFEEAKTDVKRAVRKEKAEDAEDEEIEDDDDL
jgi:uncharacterized protein YjbJ (UPF0337 family)